MDRRYFFVRLKRDVLESDLYEIESIGKIAVSGLGTAIDPDAVWVVLSTVQVATIPTMRERLTEIGFGHFVDDIRVVKHPDEGRVMAQQLGLFN